MKRVRFIRRAKELGFTLAEIRELLELRTEDGRTCEDVRELAEAKVGVVEERIRLLAEMNAALKRLVSLCSTGGPAGECPFLDALDDAAIRPTP